MTFSLLREDKITEPLEFYFTVTVIYFLTHPMPCLHRRLSPAQACSRPPSSPSTPCTSPGQPWPTTPVSLMNRRRHNCIYSELEPDELTFRNSAEETFVKTAVITTNSYGFSSHFFIVFCVQPQTGSVTLVCWVWSSLVVQLHHQGLLLLPQQTSSGGTHKASWDWSFSCSVLFTPGISLSLLIFSCHYEFPLQEVGMFRK